MYMNAYMCTYVWLCMYMDVDGYLVTHAFI